MNLQKRILPVLLALVLIASGYGAVVLFPVSAAPPPASGEYTYEISKWTDANITNSGRTIAGITGLDYAAAMDARAYLLVDAGHTGLNSGGKVLRSGTTAGILTGKVFGGAVLIPSAYKDTDTYKVYPIKEISGKRTLSVVELESMRGDSLNIGSSFIYRKAASIQSGKNDDYYAVNVVLCPTAAGGLEVRAAKAQKPASKGIKFSAPLSGTSNTNIAASFISYDNFGVGPTTAYTLLADDLIALMGLTGDAAIKAKSVLESKTNSESMTASERWVDYRLFYDEQDTPNLELTLHLDYEGTTYNYTFVLSLGQWADAAWQASEPALGLGGFYRKQKDTDVRTSDYYADFTVKYEGDFGTGSTTATTPSTSPTVTTGTTDTTGSTGTTESTAPTGPTLPPETPAQLDASIAALAPYTLKDKPDLLTRLKALEAIYNTYNGAQKAEVTNGGTLINAITALEAGNYFYDPLDTAEYWAQGSVQSSYAYHETKDTLPAGSQMVSVSGQMRVASANGSVEGVVFDYRSTTQYYWIGIDNRSGVNAGRLFGGGRSGTTVDITNESNRRPLDANFIEGDYSLRFKSGTWVDFTYAYDFAIGAYVYTVSGVDSGDQPIKLVYKSSGPITLDSNVRLVSRVENFPQNFRNISVGILDSNFAEGQINALPDPENVTVDDEDAITVVSNIINNRLSGEERAKISSQAKTRLDAVLAKLAEKIKERDDAKIQTGAVITFEPDEAGKDYFEAIRANAPSGWNVVENPFKTVGNTSGHVLEITPNYANPGDGLTNYAIYKLKDAMVSGKKLLSNFSGKVHTSGNAAMVVYDFKSADEWSGFRIYRNAAGDICFRDVKKPAEKTIPTNYETVFSFENEDGHKTTGNVWADFNVEYTLLTCKITVRIYDETGVYLGGYDRVSNLLDTCETQVGFAALSSTASTKAYIDDIFVDFQEGQAYTDAKIFMNDHAYILNLIPAETYLSYNDLPLVQTLRTAYDALSDNAKRHIPFVGTRLENLEAARTAYNALSSDEKAARQQRDEARLAALEKLPGDYQEYTVTENFENGDLSLFQPAKGNSLLNTGVVEVVDNDVFGSKALHLNGRSVITLKELLRPERPQVAKVEYKVYIVPKVVIEDEKSTSNNKQGMIVYFNYSDFFNYRAINFHESSTSRRAQYNTYTPPMTTSYSTTTDLEQGIVWNVSMTISNRGNVNLNITDTRGTVLTITQSTTLYTLFTLGSNDYETYIDDLSVTYRKGNYDIDEEITDINVYYTANTWVKPGDVALVSGENLKGNVGYVKILSLPNNTGTGKGFIDRTYFDYDGVHKNEFSQNPQEAYWQQAEEREVEIVQWTDNSLKFVVPADLANGIYAVRLYSSRTAGLYETIYINAPGIDYTVGADGGIVPPGSTMRVIGKNLAQDMDISKLKAVIVDKDKNAREITVSAAQSNYSISVDIPADLTYGEYELWVYGGYGDDTAWAIPTKFTIARAVRDSWSKTVFNIRDYGAIGETSQNATPIFVNVLAAIAENGGGILYLPAGQYDINTSLIIPENCVITGDGPDKTAINFRPYAHAINKLPIALFRFTKNVEFSNFAVRGSRVSGVFRGYTANCDNLYFENLYIAIQPYAGTVTEGTGGTYRGLVSSSELYGMVSMEAVNPVLLIHEKGSNVQIRNYDASRTFGRNRPIFNENNGSYYWQVDNIKTTGGWSEVIISKSLWENSQHGPNSCLGVWGNGLYFANNRLFDRTDNNRELYVADRNAPYRDQITPLSDAPDNVKFYLVKSLNRKTFTDKDMQLYVVNGQGVGQTREIIGYDDTSEPGKYIAILNRPFTVAPNRNSTIVIRRPRENIFFVNNDYSNGGAGGFYGGVADVVYDGNTWTNVNSIYQMGIFSDVNWYLSIVRDVVNQGPNGLKGFDWRASSGRNAQKAFLMRECRTNGMYMSIKPDGTNSLIDVIIDNNIWSGSDYAITFDAYTSGGRFENMDGALMARNVLEHTPYMFNPATLSVPAAAMATTNSASSKRLIMLNIPLNEDDFLLGDVNRDGKVSLKDATMILFSVIGKIELSEMQKKAADVDGDPGVTTRDATMIRMYLVGIVQELIGLNP